MAGWFGSLEGLVDSERRPLRPIGMTAREAAARTESLLGGLAGAPGVRLFAGVPVAAGAPPVAFLVSAGRRVLLIESIAWPAGAYATTPSGDVLCDGTYIGQSVHPLLGAVRRLRRVLRRRQVAAAVVVHPSSGRAPSLPTGIAGGAVWLGPGDVRGRVARAVRCAPRTDNCHGDIISWYRRCLTSPQAGARI